MADEFVHKETIFGRCLRCWYGVWVALDCSKGYPQTFPAVCPKCQGLRTFTPTGRMQPLRTAGQLRHLQTSVKNRVEPFWEQLTFPPVGMGVQPVDTRVARDDPQTVAPAASANKKGSGSTRPRQSPVE